MSLGQVNPSAKDAILEKEIGPVLKKTLYFFLILLVLLVAGYLLGPRPNYPDIDYQIEQTTLRIDELENHLAQKEATVKNLKPDNQSRIVWADSTQSKTPYAIVYLHGFSASPMESKPVHLNFAQKYGMNMILPRLAQHGRKDTTIFKNLTPKMLIDDAKEAIAMAQLLGEKVIVMSCSTGSTLAIPLAAENPDLVEGHIMFSPNFALADERASLLTKPWGLQIARYMLGSKHRRLNMPPICHGFWTMKYRLEGALVVQGLIDETMKTQYFEKIDDPVFVGYYYENEDKKDRVISIAAIKHFMGYVSTPTAQIQEEPFPTTKAHVLSSSLQSKDVAIVQQKLDEFATQILKLEAQ